MKLDSSNSPIFLPDREQTSVLRLGFENCSAEQWIISPWDLTVFFRHKIELASSRSEECYAQSQGSAETQREFHAFLLQHLLANTELGYSRLGNQLIHEKSGLTWELDGSDLWLASLWVPEDICLLEKQESDYTLTAASICSPSNWILGEKIEQSVDFIHAPVPGYQTVLGTRVNRFLDNMKSGRVVLRYNWSIQGGNELFWRDDLDPGSEKADSPAAQLYWRIERQTFTRLPESGAIVFGIRIFLHSLTSLQNIEGFDKNIAQLLAQLPDAEKRYKSL